MAYRDPERLMCLRCDDVALGEVEIAGIVRRPCPHCAGLWIADDQLRELMIALGLEPDEPLGPIGDASALACPICRTPMVEEHAYGEAPVVAVDVCAEHGVWFDRAELEVVIERLHLEREARDPAKMKLTAGQMVIGQLTGGVSTILAAIRASWRGPEPRPVRARGRRA